MQKIDLSKANTHSIATFMGLTDEEAKEFSSRHVDATYKMIEGMTLEELEKTGDIDLLKRLLEEVPHTAEQQIGLAYAQGQILYKISAIAAGRKMQLLAEEKKQAAKN